MNFSTYTYLGLELGVLRGKRRNVFDSSCRNNALFIYVSSYNQALL